MRPNKIIQNYKVTHLLGSGGMGEVWGGKHLYMDRQVAIKALHPSLLSNPEIKARFKNEAVTLSQLDHPNIVRLYDYIEETDAVYLVMEYVVGDPLDQYIARKSGPIPEPAAKSLFAQILQGIAYAHAQGVIHRDIKPGNFMITPQQQVKILDFGIAKLLENASSQRTKTGSRIGTVLYMSPEQVRGQEVDARSDIYALGVTLFQMLTGQCPYSAQATEYDVYQRIVNEPLPRAASLYPAISAQMQALIDQATAKAPAARFQSCEAFLAALEGREAPISQPTRPATAPPTTASAPNSTPKPRKRGLAKVLIGLLIVGGMGAAAYQWGWPILQRELRSAQERTPSVVAQEFLTAIEEGRDADAEELAGPMCVPFIDLTRMLYPQRTHRTVHIIREYQEGNEAHVRYNYDNDHDSHILDLTRRQGEWKVQCELNGLY